MSDETCIIMPFYNEQQVVAKTIKGVAKKFPLIVCVDDGSSDNSAAEVAKTNAILVSHPINFGQGAALQTGIEFALKHTNAKYFVTFDADGQHSVHDVDKMLAVLKKQPIDVVLGSRFLGSAINMPLIKKILFKLAIAFTNIFSGVRLTDTHNGLRAFNRDFAQRLNIAMPGMAHASEIIDKIGRHKWRYKEVPVTISYDDYSNAKGQSVLNFINVLADILLNRFAK